MFNQIMSIYTDLKKLIDKSNKDYINQFMNHVQKESYDTTLTNKVRDMVNTYVNMTQSSFVAKKCQYIIQRGANNGKQCTTQVKDINGSYCIKHKKYEVIKEVEAPVSDDNGDDDEIIDDPVASDADDDEWFEADEGGEEEF